MPGPATWLACGSRGPGCPATWLARRAAPGVRLPESRARGCTLKAGPEPSPATRPGKHGHIWLASSLGGVRGLEGTIHPGFRLIGDFGPVHRASPPLLNLQNRHRCEIKFIGRNKRSPTSRKAEVRNQVFRPKPAEPQNRVTRAPKPRDTAPKPRDQSPKTA